MGRSRALAVAAAFGFALTLTGAAFAQPIDERRPRRSCGQRRLIDVLDESICRPLSPVQGSLTPEGISRRRAQARERPSKNFGNVLKLDELAANPHFILPGNPFGSKLFKQIVDKEMPYDVEYEGETKYPKITPGRTEGARGLDRVARRDQERGLRIAQIRQPTTT